MSSASNSNKRLKRIVPDGKSGFRLTAVRRDPFQKRYVLLTSSKFVDLSADEPDESRSKSNSKKRHLFERLAARGVAAVQVRAPARLVPELHSKTRSGSEHAPWPLYQ
eukprot:SAG11_NODE_928_length_6510_cov_5.490251_2_plen_108_part_00